MRDSDKYQWLLSNLQRHGKQTWAVHLDAPEEPWNMNEKDLDALIVREIMHQARKSVSTEESV